MERDVPQTVAIEEEPFDSVISETVRIVYGKDSDVGKSGLIARLRVCRDRFRGVPENPCGRFRQPSMEGKLLVDMKRERYSPSSASMIVRPGQYRVWSQREPGFRRV